MEMKGSVLDFSKICRLCLSEETVMSSLYNESDHLTGSVPLPLRIMACVSVEYLPLNEALKAFLSGVKKKPLIGTPDQHQAEMYNSFSQVSSADGLPSQICASCLCQVDGWYKFKDLCENADSLLRKYLKNEPVQIESISHIQNLAQEIKKYFSFSQTVKEECNGMSQNQSEPLSTKIKTKTVENENAESIRQYALPKYGTRGTSSRVSQIKEELDKIDDEEDYDNDNGDCEDNDDEDTDNIVLSEDEKSLLTEGYTFSSENQEKRMNSKEFDEALDNETLANRIRSATDSSDVGLKNDYSSDDSMTLSAKKKKLLKEKNKVRIKKKIRDKKESGTEVFKQARTIQTQTGADEDFVLEIVETNTENSLDDVITTADKKKIKSRKTQTPKEKSPPKKRFRIRPAVPSSCTLCDKVYKNSEILRQHMKSHHVTGTIECPNCKLTFTSLRSLKYHEQRKHSNLEPVPCTFCGKKFLDKKYLRIHENIHSQVNQYVCQFCGRKFIMKTNLTVHISRHHTLKTNDFICQVCGKAFPFKLYLKKHFKTHTDYKPYQCNYCEAKFRENTLLRKHVNSIHLKLRPFLCQYCHKTFTRSLYLREHMESQHLGIQKKIECSRCGENFQNRNRLRQHECEGRLEVL